jgi:membrane protein
VTATEAIVRVRTFLDAQLWRTPLAGLPAPRAAAYRAARVLVATVRGFFEHGLMLRAAALTYYSVLSVVPLLAFAFAVLKGFGAYQALIEGTVRPYVEHTFAANPPLEGAILRVLRFVDQTDVSRLGTLAVLFLLYTSVTLLSSVEEALNDVFGARTKRSLLRQLTDYTTLLVTAPILVVVATTLSTAAQSSRFVELLRRLAGLGAMIDFLVGLTPLVAVGVALFAIYVILPNVRVRVPAALVGAAVAALLWQGALVLHVRSQLGVARYNALYSGLAAVPIFLVWMYVSWTIVLVGAQLAEAYQDVRAVRQRLRARRADPALREMLAVAAGAAIARAFVTSGPWRGAAALAEALDVPAAALEDVLDALCRAGLVARTGPPGPPAYLPARDLDAVRVEDLRQALRCDPGAGELREAVLRAAGPALREVLRDVEGQRDAARRGPTLRELAATSRATAPPDPKDPATPA